MKIQYRVVKICRNCSLSYHHPFRVVRIKKMSPRESNRCPACHATQEEYSRILHVETRTVYPRWQFWHRSSDWVPCAHPSTTYNTATSLMMEYSRENELRNAQILISSFDNPNSNPISAAEEYNGTSAFPPNALAQTQTEVTNEGYPATAGFVGGEAALRREPTVFRRIRDTIVENASIGMTQDTDSSIDPFL